MKGLIKYRLVFTLLFWSCLFGQADKLAISILDFEGEGINDRLLDICYQRLETNLIESNRFIVIERKKRDEIIEQWGDAYDGACDEECAVEMGKLLSAHYLMSGKIIGYAGFYQINIKIIDIEKGSTLDKVTEEVEGETKELLSGITNASQEITRRITLGSAPQQVLQQTGLPATVQKTYGSVDISTDPLGANILLDGIDKGVTPKIIEKIETGSHNLVLAYPGYETLQKRIMVEDGKTKPISEYLIPQMGSLTILSEPIGAAVYLDGMPRGTTPLNLSELPVKDYMVRVELQDYETKENRVAVQYRQNIPQKYELNPLPGKLTLITYPMEVSVMTGSRDYKSSKSGLLTIELPEGRHRLDFFKSGYEPLSKQVRLGANETKTLDIILYKIPAGISSNPDIGFLTLKTNALKAQARISGVLEPVPVPFEYYELLFGNYDLEVSARGYESKETQATIIKQKTTRMEVNLDKKLSTKAFKYSLLVPGRGQRYAGKKAKGYFFSSATVGLAAMLGYTFIIYQDENPLVDQYRTDYQNAVVQQDIETKAGMYQNQVNTVNDLQSQLIIYGGSLVATYLINVIDAKFFSGL